MAWRWSRTVAFACVTVLGACGSDDAGRNDATPPRDGGLGDVSPDAGTGDGALPDGSDGGAPACDDGDPCTQDALVDGKCTHSVAPDGTPCNDGVRCTGDDRCSAGVCRGTELTPHVQARGHYLGFGAAPNEDGHPLNGLGELVSDQHMLFLDTLGSSGTTLSLVEVTASGLAFLDRKQLGMTLGWDADSPRHSRRTTTLLVPLGDDRAALIASKQRIEIFDTSSGKIVSVGQLLLHPASETILAGVGRGSRFYTCEKHLDTAAVAVWEVGPTGVVLERSRFELPNTSGLPNTCNALALSPDGLELVVASREGLERADVTDPAKVTLKTRFRPDDHFWRVALEGSFIVVQRPHLSSNPPQPIEVYRRSALEADPRALPELRFTSTPRGEMPARWPLGFAFVADGLAVEWKVQDASGFSYVTEIRSLPGGPAHNATFTHRASREDRIETRTFPLARRGNLLVVPPWRTVLRYDPAADVLTALGQAAATGFEVVLPGNTDHVTALSALGIHDVDVHDPDAPTVTSQPLARDLPFYRWQPGGAHRLAAPLGLANSQIPSSRALTLKQKQTPVGCFTPAGGAIAPSGLVNIADDADIVSPGQLLDLGRALLHTNQVDGGTTVRLRWYDAPAACNGQTLTPTIDGEVDIHPEHLWFATGGDASGAPAAVVADVREIAPTTTAIRWLEREPGQSTWRTVASTELVDVLSHFVHVEVHGDLALVHDDRRIVIVRRSGSTLSVVAHKEIRDGEIPEDLTEILSFDERFVFATTTKAPQGVLVLRTGDLERIARFTTHGLARTMAETNGKIVFGSPNAIDVVDSLCPP